MTIGRGRRKYSINHNIYTEAGVTAHSTTFGHRFKETATLFKRVTIFFEIFRHRYYCVCLLKQFVRQPENQQGLIASGDVLSIKTRDQLREGYS